MEAGLCSLGANHTTTSHQGETALLFDMFLSTAQCSVLFHIPVVTARSVV